MVKTPTVGGIVLVLPTTLMAGVLNVDHSLRSKHGIRLKHAGWKENLGIPRDKKLKGHCYQFTPGIGANNENIFRSAPQQEPNRSESIYLRPKKVHYSPREKNKDLYHTP